MAKIKSGYRAVHAELNTEEGLAVLTFVRADGKPIVATLNAEQVVSLSQALMSLIDLTPQTVTEDDGTQRVDIVTATPEENDNGTD